MRVKGQAAVHLLSVAAAIGWEKLMVAIVALAGATVLGAIGRIGSDAVVGIYTLVIGYVLGAGTTAAKSQGGSS